MSMNALSPAPQRHPNAPVALLVQLAAIVTVAAAAVAWILASVARLPEQAVVISVMAIAFVASWSVTNHRSARSHRVTVVRARVRTH